jgi:hypothetical protein
MIVEISWADAVERGLRRYFTGIPCPHGHVCERSVSRRACLECDRARKRRENAKISARVAAARKGRFATGHTHIGEVPRSADHEPRLAYVPPPEKRSLTGELMGDPPPSRSALARRQAGQAQ